MSIEKRNQKRDAAGRYDFSKGSSGSNLASGGLQAAEPDFLEASREMRLYNYETYRDQVRQKADYGDEITAQDMRELNTFDYTKMVRDFPEQVPVQSQPLIDEGLNRWGGTMDDAERASHRDLPLGKQGFRSV